MAVETCEVVEDTSRQNSKHAHRHKLLPMKLLPAGTLFPFRSHLSGTVL